jgi:N-acetylglucosaminyl-diphospho-decaprenol L-rhamnosyltransferase
MPDIAMVIVSYRSGPQIEALLASTGGTVAHLTITVANNATGDDLTTYLAAHPSVRVREMGSNLGYGSAINRVVTESADPEWVLIVNPDVIFEPGSIDELLRVAESDTRIGVVGPQIRTSTGDVYPSARRLPSLRTGVGHALFSRVWRDNPWTHRYLADRELPPRERDAGWLSGACLLVRGSVFRQLHGFDDGYFMYFEDVDFGKRVGEAGYRNVYAPSAIVTHSGAHATSSAGRVMIRAHHASAYRFMADKYSGWYLWPLRAALRVGLAVRSRAVRR